MLTLDQAKALRHGDILHYTGPSGKNPAGLACAVNRGPRGGVTESVVRVRVTGAVKTWKTRPNDVRVPIKHGMYESTYITEANLQHFHLASECPADIR